MKFFARINKGEIEFWNAKQFDSFCQKLEGKEIEVEIKKKTRGLKQNAYYWANVIQTVADEMGELEPEEVHEMFKARLLPRKFIKIKSKKTGQVQEVEIKKSTRKLKTDEFADYVSKCKIWASLHLGIEIPD